MNTRIHNARNQSPKITCREWIILYVGIIAAVISLSCKLPFDFFQSKIPGGSSRDELAVWGLEEVEVSIRGNQAIIQYDQGADESPEVLISGWLMALEAASEEAPDAQEILLQTTFEGETFLEITADADDVRALTDEEISPDEMLERLVIVDQRSPERRIFSRLVKMGLNLIEVNQSESLLYIEYYPEPAEDQADLMNEWLEILMVVVEEKTQAETVEIRALMLDTSVFVVETEMTDLGAFFAGELSVFEILARMTISEEPVVLEE